MLYLFGVLSLYLRDRFQAVAVLSCQCKLLWAVAELKLQDISELLSVLTFPVLVGSPSLALLSNVVNLP